MKYSKQVQENIHDAIIKCKEEVLDELEKWVEVEKNLGVIRIEIGMLLYKIKSMREKK